MIDPITAIGLVASIVQLVELGATIIKRLNDYQSQCKEIPEAFYHVHAQLPLLLQILEQTRQDLDAGAIDDDTKVPLGPTIDRCKQQVQQLDEVLLVVVPQPNDSRATRVRKALLSLKKESGVSRIHGHLATYVSTLTCYFAWRSNRPHVQPLVTQILTVLSVPDPSLTYQKSLKVHHPETGKWFLDGGSYIRWKTDPASIIWLHGGPGCGKTVLSSAIIRDLETEVNRDVAKACAYHFFTFNDKAEQKPANMMKSLISQLIVRCVDIPPTAKRLSHEVTPTHLEAALHHILADLRTVYLVIDALDECDKRQQDELTAVLTLIIGWKLDHVHILMTSRKEQDLEYAFETMVSRPGRIQIQPSDVDADIGLYINARLASDKKFRQWKNDLEIRRRIEVDLTSGANGMFRWAACQMDDLATCVNKAMIFRSLKNLPKTLDETYDRILHSIEESYAPYALQVLRWLAFARISLTVAQVCHVAGIIDNDGLQFDENEVLDPRDILTVCKSLVTVVEADHIPFEASVVRLAHFTVQQYLTSDRIQRAGHSPFYSLEPRPTEALIAKQCIAYLMEFGNEANNPRGAPFHAAADENERFPLAAYALYEWNYHSKAAAPDKSVDFAALRFMRNPVAYFNCFIRFGKELSRKRDPGSVLSDACRLGFTGVVQLMLDIVPRKSLKGGTADVVGVVALPVVFTQKSDQAWTKDFVLETSGLDSDAFIRALGEAAHHDHQDILDLWIDRQDDVESAIGAVLMAAARTGQTAPLKWTQSRRLVSGDQSLGRGDTDALPEASGKGHLQVMEELLELGVDINGFSSKGTAALEVAASANQAKAVQFLLENGADVNVVGGEGTLIYSAVALQRIELVRLLLDNGARLDVPGPRGLPVHLAAERSLVLLKLLIRKDVTNISALSPAGETVFEIACRTGNLEMVKYLIREKADVNAPGPNGTALQLAVESGSTRVVDFLLCQGAKVKVGGPKGNALEIVCRGKREDVARLLVLFAEFEKDPPDE